MTHFRLPQKPTERPTNTDSPTSCESLRFHFNYGICNNEYQLTGLGNSGYDNLDHCCMMNDDRFETEEECRRKANDICRSANISVQPTRAPVTPSPTNCGSRRFYYHSGTCTNEVQRKYSQGYSSLEKCCWFNNKRPPYIPADNLEYSGMEICDVIDICNPRPPTSKHFEV